MSLIPLLADVSGSNVINGVLMIIVFGVIFALLFWLISYLKLPEPFEKVARVVLAIAAVILLINVLLSLVGKAFIHW